MCITPPAVSATSHLYVSPEANDSLDSDVEELEDTIISLQSNASIREVPVPVISSAERRRQERENRRRKSFELPPKPQPSASSLGPVDVGTQIMEGIKQLVSECRQDRSSSKATPAATKRKVSGDDEDGEQELPVLTEKVATT